METESRRGFENNPGIMFERATSALDGVVVGPCVAA